MRFTVTDENDKPVITGTPRQVIREMLIFLDSIELHQVQVEDLPRERSRAVMDERRVPAAVIPAPSCEHGWDHEDEFDGTTALP